MSLQLDSISVSDMDNNCYLLYADGDGLLIDAAADADRILELADRHGVTISKVLTTHRHWDHIRALVEVLERTGAAHLASYLDAPALPAPVDRELSQGDVISHAGAELAVSILRGHTPGGVAVAAPIGNATHLFTGDSLFPGGLGKTSSESDFVRLYRDVEARIFEVYPNETPFHPGHGPSSTLGAERPHLETWWQRRW